MPVLFRFRVRFPGFPFRRAFAGGDQYIGDAEMFLEIWRVDTGALVARQSRPFRLDLDSSDPESTAALSIPYPDAMVPGVVYSARVFTRVVGKTPWRRAIIDFRGQ